MSQITHASNGESSTKNGNAGDQTGKEVYTRNWYDGGWVELIHHPNEEIRKKASDIAVKLGASNLVGYDQNQRTTLYVELKRNNWDVDRYIKSAVKTETDCSAFVTTCYACVVSSLQNESYLPNTSSLSSTLMRHGFQLFTKASGYNLSKDDNLVVGDLVNRPSTSKKGGHVVMITSSDGVELPNAVPAESSGSYSDSQYSDSESTMYQKRAIMPSRGSNTVYQMSSSVSDKRKIMKQSDERKEKFKRMVTTMTNSAPELGRSIVQTSEMYDSSILKGNQTNKRERT